MKLIEKTDLMDGDWSYQWTAEELKNEKDCLRLAISACTLGELDRVECRGYMDMDTHENYCSFKSQRDFANGLDQVKKIEADGVTLDTNHPFAGKVLNFVGTVRENREATEEEVQHLIKHLTGGCEGCGKHKEGCGKQQEGCQGGCCG